jgi:hypothetical protein
MPDDTLEPSFKQRSRRGLSAALARADQKTIVPAMIETSGSHVALASTCQASLTDD